VDQPRPFSPPKPPPPTIHASTRFAAMSTTGLGNGSAASSSLFTKAGATVTVPCLLDQSKTNVDGWAKSINPASLANWRILRRLSLRLVMLLLGMSHGANASVNARTPRSILTSRCFLKAWSALGSGCKKAVSTRHCENACGKPGSVRLRGGGIFGEARLTFLGSFGLATIPFLALHVPIVLLWNFGVFGRQERFSRI
jgi:hypothetical protein